MTRNLVLVLAACGAACGGVSSQDAIDRDHAAGDHSESALDHARAAYLARNHLTAVDAARYDGALPSAVASPPDGGLQEGESIVMLPGGVGLITTTKCASCECDPEASYQVATGAGGKVVILRLDPHLHIEHIHQAGSCGVGCGQPTPRMLPSAIILPATDVANVSIADVPYDARKVEITCDHPIPRP